MEKPKLEYGKVSWAVILVLKKITVSQEGHIVTEFKVTPYSQVHPVIILALTHVTQECKQ